MTTANIFAIAVEGLRLRESLLVSAPSLASMAKDEEFGFKARLDRNRAALAVFERLATIADGITYDCDDGRGRVALGDEYREMVSTPDRSRSYGLRWSVDGETPEGAEAEALLVLASALRCRYLQEVAPCL